MPQLILLVVVGVVAYVGYRTFIREAERVSARLRRAEASLALLRPAETSHTGAVTTTPLTTEVMMTLLATG